jgi:hypothetical protein
MVPVVPGLIERARTVSWKSRATALGLTVFVVWFVLLNVGPFTSRVGHILLALLAGVALVVGTTRLRPRRRS